MTPRLSERPRSVALGLGALLLAALAAWLGLRGRPATPAPPARVVVVLIDTLRRDHLPVYGYARRTAPFLERLAAEGLVFEHAYSTSSWTAPATASLFTSLYPFQHGVTLGLRATRKLAAQGGERVQLRRLPEEAETLPEVLRRAGYATFGITQNINISRELGFAQGFDRFVNQPADDTAEVLNAKLHAWRRRLEAVPRYFLYLHYLDPHSPYRERAPWFDPHSSGRDRVRSAYDSEIAYVDEHLRQAYEAFGWARDTLLVVTADHGEEFWEHGSVEHGRSLFGEVLNVPLVVRLPNGAAGGRRVAAPVSLIDVLPTVAAAVGVPAPAQAQGHDLVALANARPAPARTLFAHLWRPEPAAGFTYDLRATLAQDHKMIDGNLPRPLLFDLLRDPLDQDGLEDRRGDVLAQLLPRYAAFSRAAASLAAPATDIPLDAEAREQLRALGYVE